MSSALKFSRTMTELARQQVTGFARETPGVVSAVLMTGDGFEVVTHQTGKSAPSKMAAMGSSMQALAEALVREAGLSGTRNILIEADAGTILILSIADAKPRMNLAVVADKSAILGHLMWASKNCCQGLGRVFPS